MQVLTLEIHIIMKNISNYPWLSTPPSDEFKEGFTSVTNISGTRKFPYTGPSGRTHYGYTNGMHNSVKDMVNGYYYTPLPYYVYENWNLNQGPYGTLQ